VRSLGREAGASRLTSLFRFYSYVLSERARYDAVFVHMNPEYLVLGGMLWRLMGKKAALWYTHKSLTWRLRLGSLFADVIFTAVPESIRLTSRKIVALGHGIDTDAFKPGAKRAARDRVELLSVGRITPSKGIHRMLEALDVLHARAFPFRFTVVGAPVMAGDFSYEAELRESIARRPYAAYVEWRGPVPYADLPAVFQQADLFLNISATGGLDKVILESILSGVPAASSNQTSKAFLEDYGLFIDIPDAPHIAECIITFLKRPDRDDVARSLRAFVEERHSLARLAPMLLEKLSV
jgi:glycosyltransferase involved in cell wall biosynthesis